MGNMKVLVHSAPRTATRSTMMMVHNIVSYCYQAHYIMDRRHKWANKIDDWVFQVLSDKKDWKAITIVRDPIERNLSDFWRFCWKRPGLPRILSEMDLRFYAEVDHWLQHSFIAHEIEPFWDVNVYDVSFHPPYQIYDDHVLIIRFDEFQSCLPEALTEFLGFDFGKFAVPHENSRADFKKVVPEKVTDKMVLSEYYVDAIYDWGQDYFIRHFWSEQEIKRMKEKWLSCKS